MNPRACPWDSTEAKSLIICKHYADIKRGKSKDQGTMCQEEKLRNINRAPLGEFVTKGSYTRERGVASVTIVLVGSA
jgi:hypothetical protein